VCAALICVANNLIAQAHNYTYYMNSNLKSVPKKEAIIVGKGYKQDNSVLVDFYQIKTSKLILSIEYTDSTLKEDRGIFQSYHDNGSFENNGTFLNGKKNGLWMKYDSLSRTLDSINYQMGRKLNYKEQSFNKNGVLTNVEVCDSIAGTLSLIINDSLGAVSKTYIFTTRDKGIATYYENGSSRTENLSTQERKEAVYKGGLRAWQTFLERNVDPMYLIEQNAPAGLYSAIIKFVINEEGEMVAFVPETNLGYGLEMDIISKMKKGGKWIPATMFGKNVKAYRRQPITFLVPSD
jgi:hypothetical protein